MTTESVNPETRDLDQLSTIELVRIINREDSKVATAVADQASNIAMAIDVIANRMEKGGRLIYVGAGTSGRLGVLDAAECPPTFNANPGQVIGLIAGGPDALLQGVEGAEDSADSGATDLSAVDLAENDVVVGITASGRTPYVLGALDYARSVGAATIGFTCNRDAPVIERADVGITTVVGPEVLTGSTRMKAGTATKLVLNMLTTGAMVCLGKTYGNLMVDLQATNEKLVRRMTAIIIEVTNLSGNEAEALLNKCDRQLKTAIVCHRLGVKPDVARARISMAGGRLRAALQEHD